MLAINLISKEIPVLHSNDKVGKGLAWMEEYKLSELAVLEKNLFIGMIKENQLLDCEDTNTKLAKLKPFLHDYSVQQGQHIYEVISKISQQKLSSIAVIDKDKNYIGIIDLPIIMQSISTLTAMKDPGGILQLSLNVSDYSLSEIASIVESNNAKILSSYIYTNEDSNKMEVTIKINKDDLSAILQTFERYNYNVAAFFHKNDMEDDLKKRYDGLIHYLNM